MMTKTLIFLYTMIVVLIIIYINFPEKEERLTFYIEPFSQCGAEAFFNIKPENVATEMTNTEIDEIKQRKLKYCKSSKEEINDRLKKFFTKMNIEYTTDPKNCTYYIPYWYSDDELSKFISKHHRPNMILNVIPGVDYLNRKNKLWEALVEKLGRDKAGKIMPPSYSIFNNEWTFFEKEYKQGDSYILKTEEENAQGIFVYKDLQKIKNKIVDKKATYPVTIIQQFIKPLLIKNRVFKLRLFLFIKCKKGIKDIYIHKQGSVFYSKEIYNENNLTYENIVANAYWFNAISLVDVQAFLNKYPRNLVQVKKYFNTNKINSKKIFNDIKSLLKKTTNTLKEKICTVSKLNNNIKVGLFGIDIIIDNNLKPWLIEMNVSPSSTAFDKLGEEQKKQVWVDTMKITLLKNPKNHQFEKI